MSPITFTQQGIITQYELAKILIIMSDGVLEVTLPLTDDDRRTFVGAPSEDGPCGERYEVLLTESRTAVMVTRIVHRNAGDLMVTAR
jgi:hypothetical protein